MHTQRSCFLKGSCIVIREWKSGRACMCMHKDTLTLKGKRWEALCVLTVYPLGQCWYNSSYRPVQLDVQCRKFHRSNYTHFFQADVFIINSSSSGNWEEYLLLYSRLFWNSCSSCFVFLSAEITRCVLDPGFVFHEFSMEILVKTQQN